MPHDWVCQRDNLARSVGWACRNCGQFHVGVSKPSSDLLILTNYEPKEHQLNWMTCDEIVVRVIQDL